MSWGGTARGSRDVGAEKIEKRVEKQWKVFVEKGKEGDRDRQGL